MLNIVKNFLSFGFFKGIVFFSVLLYSYLGFTAEYVQLEQSVALATMITPFLVLGLTTSFSHYKVVKLTSEFDWLYWRHLKYIIYILALSSIVFIALDWGHQQTIILLTLLVYSRFCSQTFKIKNDVFYSSFVDSVPYIFITICLLLLTFNLDITLVSNIMFYPVVFFIIYRTNSKLANLKHHSDTKPYEFYTFGGKAFLISAIIVSVMLLPRVFAHLIVDEKDMENFFLALRYASIGVLIYQFASIRFFSFIYKMEDKFVLIGVITIYIVSFIFIAISLNFLSYMEVISTVKFNYLAAILTAIWITSAFLEYFVSKVNGVNLFIKYFLLLFIPINFLLFIVVKLPYIQYLVVISLASVVISQLITIFYKKPVYVISSVSVILGSLLIFGMLYV
jgi:hypothetical protein